MMLGTSRRSINYNQDFWCTAMCRHGSNCPTRFTQEVHEFLTKYRVAEDKAIDLIDLSDNCSSYIPLLEKKDV